MLQPPTKFEFRRRLTFGFSINQPGVLDLLTPNLISHGVDNLPTNFAVSGLFVLDVWANNRQIGHVTLRPCPLTLEHVSVIRVFTLHRCTKCLRFVGLPKFGAKFWSFRIGPYSLFYEHDSIILIVYRPSIGLDWHILHYPTQKPIKTPINHFYVHNIL